MGTVQTVMIGGRAWEAEVYARDPADWRATLSVGGRVEDIADHLPTADAAHAALDRFLAHRRGQAAEAGGGDALAPTLVELAEKAAKRFGPPNASALHSLLRSKLGAGDSFHALRRIRLVALGSAEPGNLGGWLEKRSWFDVAEVLRRAAAVQAC